MRIAIVGAGVSGLVAARGLHRDHEVTVFEADTRIGGHTHTWDVSSGGRRHAVDTGFIVFNERNYPCFSRMLRELDIASQPTTMSFSVRHDPAGLEYNGSSIAQMFVQKRSALRPSFLRMIAEILRFNRDAVASSAANPGITVRGLMDDGGFSRAFRDWYLLPMASALWSVPHATVLDMPARYLVSFFDNHSMLTVSGRPEWRVVEGGSSRYVTALTAPFRDRIRTSCPVHRVERFEERVEVNCEPFDRLVFACHSDQALAMLVDPSVAEREILRALPYQVNSAVLHTDTSVLPRARAAWGAWNYRTRKGDDAAATVTYNMNALQSIDAEETFCVTLNDDAGIDPGRVLGRVQYHHPVATLAGETARARRRHISGPNRTHYCGAYWGNGFHEAGVVSGHAVVDEVGIAGREADAALTDHAAAFA